MSDLWTAIQDAFRRVSEQTSYQPDIRILPPWLKPHDDPEPRILLCRPENISAWRAVVIGYGLVDYFEVREDRHGVVDPGQVILMRPGAWRLP